MKSSSPRNRQRWVLLLLGIITTLCGGLLFWQNGRITTGSQAFEQRLEGEEEEEKTKEDRPDLAVAQDVERTLDPKLGIVPRERLLKAQAYAQQLLAERANRRPTVGSLTQTAWVERGPNNVGGRVRALVVDPADASGNTVWAGSVGGGLWKSTNAAATTATWQSVDNFFSNLAVTTIAFDPRNADIMYFGTGEGYYNADAIRGLGIWKSTNHGATWTQLISTAGSTDFHYVQKLLVHPTSGEVYAATHGGLMRSANGGSTWQKVLGVNLGAITDRVADVEIGADNKIYAAVGVRSGDGIYRSATGSINSWTNLNKLAGSGLPTNGFERIELACAPNDANRVYAMFQHSTTRALLDIYRSNDAGTTWTALAKPRWNGTDDFTRGQAWYDLSIGVSPTNANQLYIGGIDLMRTFDATANPVVWEQASYWNISKLSSSYVHADQHAVAFVPNNSNMVYFGCDGGVFLSTNPWATASPIFRSRNNGLNITQFYAAAIHPQLPNYFLAGAQDNGTQRFTTAGVGTTTEASGGDGAFCFIDEDQPQYQFSAYVYSNYYRSTNGGNSFNSVTNDQNGSFINPTDYDSKSNTMYAGSASGKLLVWPNATTANVTQTLTLPTNPGIVTHVTASKNQDNRVFVGTNTSKIFRIDNALAVAPAMPVINEMRPRFGSFAAIGSVSCITPEDGNDDHLLVTFSNYGVSSVWETMDGGTTWNIVEGNLPDMPVRWVLFDPENNRRALLATELGVWTTDDLDATEVVWEPSNTGLANVRVDMLRMRKSNKQIVAATHGRGLYTTDVFVALGSKGAVAASSKFIGSVYPNPFVQTLNVELSQPAAASTTITLTDMKGRVVYKAPVKSAERSVKLTTPARLSAGAYILTVRDAKQTATRQVVVQQ